jgi:hypothetical protein
MQAWLVHATASPVTHVPAPSQVEAGVTEVGPAQVAALQLEPLSYFAHFPLRQVPVVPHVLAAVAVQMLCGSGALSATAVQVPSVAVRLQAWQASEHALSQQTPCAQKVDWHSVPAPHSAPLGLRPQEAAVQTFPVMHWLLLLVQLV